MKTTRSPLLRAITALIAILLLAGCSGDDGAKEYEDGLARVQTQLEQANEATQSTAGSTDPAERQAALEQAHKSIEAAAKTAASLKPPKEASDAHGKLAEALADYAKLFGELASLEESDPRITELYGEAGPIVEQLDEANRALEKAGFKVSKQDRE
jgi:acyl-CoA reductase-like NAD-dependent aldehyde dehydrogenase